MSASQAQAIDAVGFQLVAALDAYEVEVADIVGAPLDAEQYRRVSRRMDEMRRYATALPSLSVCWVELLIRHFELTHAIWRSQQEGGGVDLRSLHAPLREAVDRLSACCSQQMAKA